ncbi:MAG: PAS domain S-box protein, partial [Candidatus Tenebribacter mawsonii]|nr:PAS domain S-box protein [Candidatus Tenebribacter mawsonii]
AGNILAWNKGAELIYGYSAREVIGMNISSMIPKNKIKEEKQFIDKIIKGDVVPSFETTRKTKAGNIVDIWMVVTKIVDEDGNPIGIASTGRDITDRKLAKEALREKTRNLNERVKELNCLYGISALVEISGIANDDFYQGVVYLIPPSFQHPNNTVCRLIINGKEYKTQNFNKTRWKLSRDIFINDVIAGTIEIYQVNKIPDNNEDPFINEEKSLLKAIAERLGHIVERSQGAAHIIHLNKILKAIRNVNQIIVREKDKTKLIKEICNNLIQNSAYLNVWIVLFDEQGNISEYAEAGIGRDFSQLIKIFQKGGKIACSERSLKQPGVTLIENTKEECGDCPLLNIHMNTATMTHRLEHEGRIFGLLSVCMNKEHASYKEEHELFQEVAGDISFSLYTIEINEEKKSVEKSLKESEEKLRNIFENSTNLFYSHTPDHTLTYLSPQVENILGYTQEEAMIKWTDFASDNPINEIGFKQTVKAIETGKRQKPYELELVKKKGDKIWVEIREVPIVEEGKTVSIVGSLTDITERKQAEEWA